MAADWVALEVEVDVHVLAETAGVVVAVGLGVAERLQDAVGLQQDVLYSSQFTTTTNIYRLKFRRLDSLWICCKYNLPYNKSQTTTTGRRSGLTVERWAMVQKVGGSNPSPDH